MKKYLYGISAIGLAFAILLISVFRSASIKYSFNVGPESKEVLGAQTPEIGYSLPFAGSVIPGNPLWPVKALRDRIWLLLTTNHIKRAEIALLFADKRLVMARQLFDKKEFGLAISTLTKGEKYLEIASQEESLARKEGMDTASFLIKLANASLKHRQIIEEEMIPLAPEDAKPDMVKDEDYAKNTYKSSRDALNNKGLPVPESPFSVD